MKPRWIIGLAVLLTAVCLSVAVLAIVRRHRSEARLAEARATDHAVQNAISLTQNRAMTSGSAAAAPKPLAESIQPQAPAELGSKAQAQVSDSAVFDSHPELEATYRAATLGRLHQTYFRLFGRLGLSSAQIEQIVSIQMEDVENEIDLGLTADALGMPKGDPTAAQIRRDEVAATQSALQSVLGPQAYQALKDYERALSVRSVADDVASFTTASEASMTGEQTEQLMQVLAEASREYRSGGRPSESTIEWDVAMNRATAFLTPFQLDALRARAQQAKAVALQAQFYASREQH